MTDIYTKKLVQASFRGVTFGIRAEILTPAGRRIVVHEYPGSNQRFVEDLGEMPPSFRLTAFVSGPNWQTRAYQLEQALRQSGPGRLVMPSFGALDVYALPYRKEMTQDAVGEVRFDLEFAAGRASPGPSKSDLSVEDVYSRGDTARSKLQDALKQAWRGARTVGTAVAAAHDIQRSVEGIVTGVRRAAKAKSLPELLGIAGGMIRNAGSLARNGNTLAGVFGAGTIDNPGLWQSVSMSLSNGAAIEQMAGLTSFGATLSISLVDMASGIETTFTGEVSPTSSFLTTGSNTDAVPVWPDNTQDRRNRNANRQAMVQATRLNALVVAYEQAADATYQSQDDVQLVRSQLEARHERMMRVDVADESLIQSDEAVRQAVEDVRLAALEVLGRKEQSAYFLTTNDHPVASSSLLMAYALYAESLTSVDSLAGRADVLRALNPAMPASRLSGAVTILQERRS